MAQEIFKRYEKKYQITMEQYQELVKQIIPRMCPDQYGKHLICNIYFDTLDYRMIRSSLEKPVYKEKLRLRSYGVPKEGDPVFIELKKKFDGVVYKRRAKMTLQEARKYLYYGMGPENKSQILREVDYAMDLYQAKPKVFLSYERIAFYGREDPELRITFDRSIRARNQGLDLSSGSYGELIFPEDRFLMEVKIPEAMPMWMSQILSELRIYPTSYSKYGTYYQNYIEQAVCERGGRICA